MRVGIVGCGYVFDHYMATWSRHHNLTLCGVYDRDRARLAVVERAYGLTAFDSLEAMLADPSIEMIVNLTSVESHVEVTRAALDAGKHVYSEKPLTTDLSAALELVQLASDRGVALSAAPSNTLGDTAQTMWKAVRDGAAGHVRIAYAEFDDNPVYLMHPETWRSRTGAPWPFLDEYRQGCTHEHAGYHLSWLCAMFGPVESLTAFSKQVHPDKTDYALDPPDTPDFSVACLVFCSGVVARITCSIGAPLDHRMRVIGDRGMITADTYRHYRCPVYVEQFTPLTLNARKARSVRRSSSLQRLFGVGGRRVPLVRNDPPGATADTDHGRLGLRGLVTAAKQRELGLQDKCLGIAELADAVESPRPYFPQPDFTLHVTELTLAIQSAGTDGGPFRPTTTFDPVAPRPGTLRARRDYSPSPRVRLLNRMSRSLLQRLHQH